MKRQFKTIANARASYEEAPKKIGNKKNSNPLNNSLDQKDKDRVREKDKSVDLATRYRKNSPLRKMATELKNYNIKTKGSKMK